MLISIIPYRPEPCSITTSTPKRIIPNSFLKELTICFKRSKSGLQEGAKARSSGSSTVKLDEESGLETSDVEKKIVSLSENI